MATRDRDARLVARGAHRRPIRRLALVASTLLQHISEVATETRRERSARRARGVRGAPMHRVADAGENASAVKAHAGGIAGNAPDDAAEQPACLRRPFAEGLDESRLAHSA